MMTVVLKSNPPEKSQAPAQGSQGLIGTTATNQCIAVAKVWLKES